MRIAQTGGASHFIGCEPSSLARGSEVWAYLPTYPRRSPAAVVLWLPRGPRRRVSTIYQHLRRRKVP